MFLAEPDIADRIADEAQEFLTGFRSEAEPDVFTDIVDSTKRASELGDRGWGALLDRHNEMVRKELERFPAGLNRPVFPTPWKSDS